MLSRSLGGRQHKEKSREKELTRCLPVAMWVSVHGRETRQGLVGCAATGIGLQEQLLVGSKVCYSYLVMEELKKTLIC